MCFMSAPEDPAYLGARSPIYPGVVDLMILDYLSYLGSFYSLRRSIRRYWRYCLGVGVYRDRRSGRREEVYSHTPALNRYTREKVMYAFRWMMNPTLERAPRMIGNVGFYIFSTTTCR